MLRFLIVCAWFTIAFASFAMAGPGDRVQGIRIFLQQGNPEQAISSAERLLSSSRLTETERLGLWQLVAEAEEFRAASGHFQQVDKAVAAIETLIKEFPDDVNEAALRWKLAWLYWKSGSDKQALAAARTLKDLFPDSREATKAWLLTARIHITQEKYDRARNDLIQHGLRVSEGSREQDIGRAWLAIIDDVESRFGQALTGLQGVWQRHPDVISEERRIYATYIRMLHHAKQDDAAIMHAEHFFKRYVKGPDVSRVRLLVADMRSGQKGADLDALAKEYEIIASDEAETMVGTLAFMRKMMLQFRNHTDYTTLKPVIIALKRIARRNQLSEVENESILNQARLWQRVAQHDADNAPTQAAIAALEDYARVVRSPHARQSATALKEGRLAFVTYLQSLVDAESWMQTVVTWERFPELRPEQWDAMQLHFDVAHALRMLMEFEQSEAILNRLYEQASSSVWGHKVMLERARLWLDRNDADGVNRVMGWLSDNEYTLYRPEMLLLAARMQLKQGKTSAASQIIASIAADDIAVEERGTYWKTRAEIAGRLSRWHVSAHAWRKYAQTSHADRMLALIKQADSLFKARDYRQAEELYLTVPDEKRTASWHYRVSICQMHIGKRNQALERLEMLKADSSAGIYASLASLALAEKQADQLLETYQ